MGKGGRAQWGDGAFQADSSNAGGLYLCLFFRSPWSLQRKISTHPPTDVTGSDGSLTQPRSRHFTKCLLSLSNRQSLLLSYGNFCRCV